VDSEWKQVSPPSPLGQNRPNPFALSTTIVISTNHPLTETRVLIFNAQGQEVRRIAIGELETGEIELKWDGLDNSGKPLPSGTYFYQLAHLGGASDAKKAIMLE